MDSPSPSSVNIAKTNSFVSAAIAKLINHSFISTFTLVKVLIMKLQWKQPTRAPPAFFCHFEAAGLFC